MSSDRARYYYDWYMEVRRTVEADTALVLETWRRHGFDPEAYARLVNAGPGLRQELGIQMPGASDVAALEELEREYMSALMAPPPTVVRDDVYPLSGVPRSLAEGLRDGRYDHEVWHETSVTVENFGVFEQGPFLEEVHLLQMNRYLWLDEIEVALDRHGMRWASAPYLMALGIQHRDVQRSVFVLSGTSAWIEAPGLELRKILGGGSLKFLEHIHLSGGRASRTIGTTRVNRMNDPDPRFIRILAIPK